MPDRALSTLEILTHLLFRVIIIPVSQMWKLRSREVKQLAHGHTAREWQSPDLDQNTA